MRLKVRRFFITSLFILFPVFHMGCKHNVTFLKDMKQELDFAVWPGKHGKLKKGFHFQLSDYDVLRNCRIVSDSITDHLIKFGLIRNLRLSCPDGHQGEEQIINIRVGVAHTNNENAHELMFMNIPAVTQGNYGLGYKRGDKEGIRIGDFNFIPVGTNLFNNLDYIVFVRNNVFCVISLNQTEDSYIVDVKSLAEQIYAKIKALPNLNAVTFDALRPKIIEFRPAKKQLVSHEDTFTTLAIQISDPANDSFTTQLSSAGQLQINASIDPPEISATHATGTLPIYLIAINTSLQFSTSETTNGRAFIAFYYNYLQPLTVVGIRKYSSLKV